MKGKFQESGQFRKELWKHKEAAKNKELLKESHLKTLSELRKESEQSKHKELVNHLPSVRCKHCIYTNGSIRASVVTELLAAGYDNRIIMELTGHKSHAMVQTYSRQLERMDPVEHRLSTDKQSCC